MRRAIALAAAAGLAVAMLAGCGKSEKTVYSGRDGKVTVKKDRLGGKEQTVNVQTEEGTATVTTGEKKTITEAELGAPVYPGAKVEVTGKYESGKSGGDESIEQHILYTPDSFDKVVAFYKANLKNIKGEQNMSSGDTKLAMFTIGEDKNQMMVQINWDASEKRTMIHVMKQKKT